MSKYETGSQYRESATSKGTGKRRTPTAIALKSRKQTKPASANPDGQASRSRAGR